MVDFSELFAAHTIFSSPLVGSQISHGINQERRVGRGRQEEGEATLQMPIDIFLEPPKSLKVSWRKRHYLLSNLGNFVGGEEDKEKSLLHFLSSRSFVFFFLLPLSSLSVSGAISLSLSSPPHPPSRSFLPHIVPFSCFLHLNTAHYLSANNF